jgi:hypothetical protein
MYYQYAPAIPVLWKWIDDKAVMLLLNINAASLKRMRVENLVRYCSLVERRKRYYRRSEIEHLLQTNVPPRSLPSGEDFVIM